MLCCNRRQRTVVEAVQPYSINSVLGTLPDTDVWHCEECQDVVSESGAVDLLQAQGGGEIGGWAKWAQGAGRDLG